MSNRETDTAYWHRLATERLQRLDASTDDVIRLQLQLGRAEVACARALSFIEGFEDDECQGAGGLAEIAAILAQLRAVTAAG